VERDLRHVAAVQNLSAFQRFVRLCAGRTGQLLNLQRLGGDAGVSHTTARHWLSILEASNIVFLLSPYLPNVSKRLVKSPKLYFYDVGFASYLIGIERREQIATHPLRGSLFENLVVAEVLKHRLHRGQRTQLHFYRDSTGHEVDLLLARPQGVLAIEVKAGATVHDDFFGSLRRLTRVLGDDQVDPVLVYDGDFCGERSGVDVTNPSKLADLLTGRLDDA
jgi:predicted AAA+ superfamily ATPase